MGPFLFHASLYGSLQTSILHFAARAKASPMSLRNLPCLSHLLFLVCCLLAKSYGLCNLIFYHGSLTWGWHSTFAAYSTLIVVWGSRSNPHLLLPLDILLLRRSSCSQQLNSVLQAALALCEGRLRIFLRKAHLNKIGDALIPVLLVVSALVHFLIYILIRY